MLHLISNIWNYSTGASVLYWDILGSEKYCLQAHEIQLVKTEVILNSNTKSFILRNQKSVQRLARIVTHCNTIRDNIRE